MRKQLDAILAIEEVERRKPLKDILADIGADKYFTNLRAKFRKAGVTAEAYTVSELVKYDIYVNGNQITWQVTQVFPEVSRRQVLIWLCEHAEEHHEIFGTL